MDCDKCKIEGKCCSFLFIELPVNFRETINMDYRHWVGLHKGITCVKVNGIWYAKIESPCTKFVDGKCEIHDTRPQICRDFDCENEFTKQFI